MDCYGLLLLLVSTLTAIKESCFAKDIHVSGSPASKDDSTCGSTYQPCASIAHALHISKDSDRILLNTFFEHVSNDSLKITNAVTISTYQTVSKTQRAVLRFQNRSSYPEQCIFKISNNVSFSSIEIVHKVEIDWAAFLLVDPCQRIIIKHCIFRVIDNELEIFSLNRNLTEIYVTDTNFIGQRQQRTGSSFKKSVPNKKKSIPGERTMPMGSQRTVITFNRCSFVNISFSFVYSEQRYRYFFVNNSAFIESEILVVNWWKSYFTNDTFRSSSLFIVSGNSTFKHCHFQRTKIDDSSLQYQLNVGDPSLPPSTFYVSTHIENCTFEKAIYGAVNLRNSYTTLRGTNFIDNTNLKKIMLTDRAGALTTYSGSLDILNCQFINNSAPPNHPGAIYSQNDGCDPPCITFRIDNTTIISGNYPGTSENTVIATYPILHQITESLNYVGNATVIQCQPNEFLYKNILYLQFFQFYCRKCDGTRYNTNYGWYKDHEFQNVTCYQCPYQASCVNGIQSKGNYWGKSDPYSGKVTFTLCPALYCCQALKNCSSYDTCSENREGRLCGDCQKGYAISLFSQNKCVPRSECNNLTVLWTMYMASAITACLFVLYGADVWNFVVNSLLKRIRKKVNFHSYQENSDEPSIDNESDQREPLIYNEIHPPTSTNKTQGNFAGLVKTAFFFYQTASIIRVEASAKTAYNMPGLISLMTSFFNIKIDVTKSAVTLCPFDGASSVVAVEAFRSSVPLMSLLMLLCLIIIVRIVMKLKNYISSILEPTQPTQPKPPSGNLDSLLQPEEQHPLPSDSPKPTPAGGRGNNFVCRLKGGYVNLMLLGYSSVALFSLRSVYCVNIDDSAGAGETYLFIQASVKCYQVWQQLMIAAILGWIVPFPIVLYVGCRLLRSRRISPNQFLLVLTFPPAAICLAFFTGVFRRHCLEFEDEGGDIGRERGRILAVLNEPFRQTSSMTSHEKDALIWEPVLIGRRLVLIVMATFILSPILRLYPVGLVLLLFAIHDHRAKPYSSDGLNLLQFLSTLVLVSLLLVNMFWALSNNIDLMKNTKFFILGEVFIVLEVVILMLPFIIALGYLTFKLIKFCANRHC